MNKKMRKLFVGLTVLFILALAVTMLPQPVLAGGGGTWDECQQDGQTSTEVVSGDVVRDMFETYGAPLQGPGSTAVAVLPNADGVHTLVIIWVVLYHNEPTDEYTVRVINVVTGCNG